MICLSCTETTLEADLGIISDNAGFIDLAEIRADFLTPDQYELLRGFPRKAGVKCILTFRLPKDGGVNKNLSQPERAELLEAAVSGGWAFLDVEDDADSDEERSLVKTAEASGVRVIKSFHDFTGVPGNLKERMTEASCGDRYIPKAAVMPASAADFIRLVETFRSLEALKKESAGYSCTNGPFLSDYILVGMGPFGVPTRIMAGAWGGMLTFASAGKVKAAPGHLSPEELVNIYHYPSLRGDTRLFGIIGRPVMHTKSPGLHNRWLRASGINGVYIPFETDDPPVILENADLLNLYGLSVTVPHKQAVIASAASVDASVSKIGACNTLVLDGGWKGYNTDWKGFLSPLESADLRGKRALVVGAGGAARAVVFALAETGMDITIVNRTAEKAANLAEEFGCSGGGFELAAAGGEGSGDSGGGFSLVVQTTSVGMEPETEGNPLPGFDFRGVETAYDIIYAPEKTRFLAEAEAAGCRIINGFPMLEAQAAEQFRLFMG